MNTHQVSFLVLSLPATLATATLIYYLYRNYGRTLLLHCLVFGPMFFLLQEYLQSNGLLLPHVYSFSEKASITLFGVPLAAVVGHIFTYTLGFALGARILRNLRLPRNVSMMMIISVPMTMGIAYMVEQCGTTAGWWTWGKGGVPWWQDPELMWMGEKSSFPDYFGLITLGPGSLGDLPHQFLGGWSIWPLAFGMAYLLLMSWKRKYSGLTPYLGYILALLLILLLVLDDARYGYILIIPIFFEGARRDGNLTVLEENLDRSERPGLAGFVKAYGDFMAYSILMCVVLYVEISTGFSVNHIPSWLILGFWVLLAAIPRRWVILFLVVELLPPVFVARSASFPALWITPFKIMYYGTVITALAFMLPEATRMIIQSIKNRSPKPVQP